MIKMHPLFHKFKFIVGYSIATVVIVIALGVSGLRLLLTTANLYQAEVEQLASNLLKQPVKIDRMDAKLSGLVPTLIFHNVQLLSKKTKKDLFSLKRIDIGLSFDDLFWKQKITPIQLTVRGINVYVTRTLKGDLNIKGVDLNGLNDTVGNTSKTILDDWLSQESEVSIEDSTFIWKDEQNSGLTWFFDNVSLLLKNSADRHQLSFSSNLPSKLGHKIKMDFDIVGNISDSSSWQAKTYIESENLNLTAIQQYMGNTNLNIHKGIADFKLWFDFNNESINQLSGDVKLYDVSYHLNKRENIKLKLISGVFDAQKDSGNNWHASVKNFNYKDKKNAFTHAGFSTAFNYKNGSFNKIHLKSKKVKLEFLSNIIIDNDFMSSNNQRILKQLNLHGDISQFSMILEKNEIYSLQARFDKTGVNAWKGIPKLEAVSGSISYNNKNGVVDVSSNDSLIGFPDLFREDFKLKNIRAKILLSNTKAGLLLNVKHLLAENEEVKAVSTAKLWIPKNESSPYLDLQTYVERGDVSKISHFLPVSIMHESLVSWLDKGILGGKVETGTVIFNGKLNEFPFEDNNGKFSVDVSASDVIIDYQDNWPKITKAKIRANFTGQGMDVHLFSGLSNNNVLRDSTAKINHFLSSDLNVNIKASGSANNTMAYLINSPILSQAKDTVNSMRWLGNINSEIKINIPLDDESGKGKPITYSGSSILNKSSLFMLEDKLDISEINGDLFFSDGIFYSKNLSAKILGEKADVIVATDKNNIKVSAIVKQDVRRILNMFDIPGANKTSGKSKFNIEMKFPKNIKKKPPSLRLRSNLLGLKSKLPGYFYKKEHKRQDFEFLTKFIGSKETQFELAFGKKSSAVFLMKQSGKNTYLDKGAISFSSRKATLPKRKVLYVDGSIDYINASKWGGVLDNKKSKSSEPILINPIIVNLDKLNIITNNKVKKKTNVTIPQKLPKFEGVIKNFSLDKIKLGRIDFKTSKIKEGLRLDELIISAKNMKIFTHGDWLYKKKRHNTNLQVTLSSDDFGNMLKGLGYSAVIGGGTVKSFSTLSWQGAPTQFSLINLDADIQLNIENGIINDINAGAGRLLGLFSLSALPRKLLGDFTDATDKGFNFDTANGIIKIEDGDAYTDDFEIKSPIATVNVSGRTGLVDRDFENTIEVVPEVGSGVAGITALLINLPAGIGIWLLDKLTGEQFNEASTKTYEINGTWEKPEIEEITEE